jgi:putative oxidoreductase
MKIAALIARILLGLAFLVFGMNGFLNFIPGSMPAGLAGQFVGALVQSHYMFVISGLQVVGGALLLANRFVPLALTVLGPIVVNIFFFHLLIFRQGAPGATVVVILWSIVAFRYRQAFSGLFVQKA